MRISMGSGNSTVSTEPVHGGGMADGWKTKILTPSPRRGQNGCPLTLSPIDCSCYMNKDPLKQYTALREAMTKRKAEIENELDAINAALGGPAESPTPKAKATKVASPKASKGPRKRAENTLSLVEAVLAVTKDKPLSKPEILAAVEKLGYKFSAKSPMNSLNTLLYTNKGIKNFDGKFGPK